MKPISRFDWNKAIEILLYITKSTSNTYNALKIIYFADKDHLSKYGRMISNDTYIAMQHGPVPSNLYNLVKYYRGEFPIPLSSKFNDLLEVKGNLLYPNRDCDLDYLSQSEIDCLDISIKQNGKLSFSDLKAKSHDSAYCSADQNDAMSFEEIIKTLDNSAEILASSDC
jgi:uncharacterized phage-associated protein